MGKILFLEGAAAPDARFWSDLNLDALTAVIRRNTDLPESLYKSRIPLPQVLARQAVFRDLADRRTRAAAEALTACIRQTNREQTRIAGLSCSLQQQWYHLQNAAAFWQSVLQILQELEACPLASEGLRLLRQQLRVLADDRDTARMPEKSLALLQKIRDTGVTVRIQGSTVQLSLEPPEADYRVRLETVFSPFLKTGTPPEDAPGSGSQWLNRIEEQAAAGMARLCPGLYAELAAMCRKYRKIVPEELEELGQDLEFYLSYLHLTDSLPECPFCIPRLTDGPGVTIRQGYDLLLAHAAGGTVVCNDFIREPDQTVITVTGANQSGKTTFARAVGIIFYLAALGFPVPCREASLFLPDRIETHFEQQEDTAGKLADDLVRLRRILEKTGRQTLVILNETFSSASGEDGRLLAGKILPQFAARGCLCLFVTFLENQRDYPGYCSQTGPGDKRTFRFLRGIPDGKARAISLARRHGLLYEQIREEGAE